VPSTITRAPADGYTFLQGTVGTQAQNQTLFKKPAYDSTKDFVPVALAVEAPLVLIARKDVKFVVAERLLRKTADQQAKIRALDDRARAYIQPVIDREIVYLDRMGSLRIGPANW